MTRPALSFRLAAALLAMAAWMGASAAAAAEAQREDHTFRRNGEVSRRLWTPEFAQGRGVSVGLALGLRGAVRQHLDRKAAPAITFELGDRAQLSVIAAPNRGAMVLLQAPTW